MGEIKNDRGTNYDADALDVMLEIIESGELELGWEARIPAATEAPML